MTTHKEQKETALWSSLTHAGIGRSYHRRSLAEIDHQPLMDWATDPASAITQGEGWNIHGLTKAYDATILLARAIHIQGQGALVLPLRRIVEWIDHDHQTDKLFEARGLFVTGFNETHRTEGYPLTGWQVAGVENMLVERLDDNRSVFLQMEQPIEGESMWTAGFRERINETNRSVSL